MIPQWTLFLLLCIDVSACHDTTPSSTAPLATRPDSDARRGAGRTMPAQAALYPPVPTALYPPATRRERTRTALPDLFALLPPKGYAAEMRNPCWMPEGGASLRCLPHFLIIGQVKAGTTDTWAFLSKHPEVNAGGVIKVASCAALHAPPGPAHRPPDV